MFCFFCGIWGSYNSSYVGYAFMGWGAVQLGRNLPTFRKTRLSPSPLFNPENVDNISREFCFRGRVELKYDWKALCAPILDSPSESLCTSGQYVLDFSCVFSNLSYLLFMLLSVHDDVFVFRSWLTRCCLSILYSVSSGLYAPFVIEWHPFIIPEVLKWAFSITSFTGKLLDLN
jgi:hypothetical protein